MSNFEVNGGQIVIRGDMDAAEGDFTGVFASDNVDAIRSVNIQDGAVSYTVIISIPRYTYDLTVGVPLNTETNLCLLTVPAFLQADTVDNNRYSSYSRASTRIRIDGLRRSDGRWIQQIGYGLFSFYNPVCDAEPNRYPTVVRFLFNPQIYSGLRLFSEYHDFRNHHTRTTLNGPVQMDYRYR